MEQELMNSKALIEQLRAEMADLQKTHNKLLEVSANIYAKREKEIMILEDRNDFIIDLLTEDQVEELMRRDAQAKEDFAEEEEERCEECGRSEKECVDAGMEFATGCLSEYGNRTLCGDCIPEENLNTSDDEEEEDDERFECSACGKAEPKSENWVDCVDELDGDVVCPECWKKWDEEFN
jgi:hypothetical protein